MENKSANRGLTFNTELLEYSREQLRIGEEGGAREFGRSRTSALVVFMVMLGHSELGGLEYRDVARGGGMQESDMPEYLLGNQKPTLWEIGAGRSSNASEESYAHIKDLRSGSGGARGGRRIRRPSESGPPQR